MKKAKRNAVIKLIVFALLVAGFVYVALYGIGQNATGKASNITLGLDLQGGLSVTYQITNDDATDEQIQATIDKLQQRVDAYSTEGEVYKEGSDRITVEIPMDTSKYDPNAILDSLGKPGALEFIDPENYELFSNGEAYEAALTGSDIANAEAAVTTDQTTKATDYIVHLQFTEEGAKKFAETTERLVGQRLYIIYDGKVASAPTVQAVITGGTAQIEGQETYEEAQQLASTIKIGALPLTLEELRSQVVGAKLGSDAVRTSLFAGMLGLIIIFLILIVVYRFPGFVSALALCCYVLMDLVFLNIFKITLTLPGIAGILLSIGMAVDANVIIFTRVKEEIANGNSIKTSVEMGFKKAFSAIFDGNITTIIAGIVLMMMGSGQVKGFAKTLILGIVLSMFTALVISRFLMGCFTDLGITNEKLYGKAKPVKVFDYAGKFKIFGCISLVAIIVGIAFLFVNPNIAHRGNSMNFSLEFSGGTSTTVTFKEGTTYDLAKAESEVVPVIEDATSITKGTVQIQVVDANNQVVFKTEELSQADRESLDAALREKFEVADIESENISSTISNEMQKDAILAVVIASILMLIYIALRFSDVRFGASAVLALIHDVMVVFMVYTTAWLSVGSTFIACMLTIVGYSINATIIIFDRIRENLHEMSVDKDGYKKIVNTSISQTLTRNIYTTLTTFATVLMLYIFGVPSLKEFTLALMAGLICGAYSSVFITGPLWLFLKTHIGAKKEEASTKGSKNSGSKSGKKSKKN